MVRRQSPAGDPRRTASRLSTSIVVRSLHSSPDLRIPRTCTRAQLLFPVFLPPPTSHWCHPCFLYLFRPDPTLTFEATSTFSTKSPPRVLPSRTRTPSLQASAKARSVSKLLRVFSPVVPAHVVITTSSYSRKMVEYYQSILRSLAVMALNQASSKISRPSLTTSIPTLAWISTTQRPRR